MVNKLSLFILLVITLYSSLVVKSEIIYDVPTNITTLTCHDESFVFSSDEINFNNTILDISGTCTLSSTDPFEVLISSMVTDNSKINKLILKDGINLIISGNNTVKDLLVEMEDSVFELGYDSTLFIKYDLIPTETEIFQGGEILINENPAASITTILNLNSTTNKVATISSSVSNYGGLNVNGIKLGLNVNLFSAKIGSSSNFYDGIFSTIDQGILSFLTCSVTIGVSADMKGGKISFNDTDYYTRSDLSQYSTIYNTTLSFSSDSLITLYRSTEFDSGITGIKLKGGSKLELLGVANTALKFRLFSLVAIYYEPNVETFIHSEDSSNDCNGYLTNSNTMSFKALNNGVLRMTGMVICSKRSMLGLLYITSKFVSNNEVNGCPDDKYTCKGQAKCIFINETCANAACVATDNLQVRDWEVPTNDPTVTPNVTTCWDGQCINGSLANCPEPFPACPREFPFRCAGKCIEDGKQCGNEDHCKTKCVEGCFNDVRECQPYYGCPLYHYQCPNFDCVTEKKYCKSGNTSLPFSNRFMKSKSYIYANMHDTAPIIGRDRENLLAYPIGEIGLKSGFLNGTLNYIKINPIADSQARKVDGSKVNSNFHYYHHLLSAPFRIRLAEEPSTTFDEPAEFYFPIPQGSDLANKPFCLAFINSKSEWECTPFEPVYNQDKSSFIIKTTHFTDFALIVKYQEESSSESSIFGNKKTLAIAVSLSVIGAVIIAAGVGAFVAFKLKYTSLRRWRVSRDISRESNRSRNSSPSTSSAESTSTDL